MYLICMKGYYNMDLTSPRTIRNIQEQFGFTFKKGLGQNFLTARNILEEIVDAAEIENGVIESDGIRCAYERACAKQR